MTSFEAYIMYLAMKAHFTRPEYMFDKYNGKVKASSTAFESRRDKYFFQKLSKHENPKMLLAACLASDPKMWIRDIVSPQGYHLYGEKIRIAESFSYLFKQDLKALEPVSECFKVTDGKHPKIVSLYLNKQILLETLVAFADIGKLYSYWDSKIQDPVLWPSLRNKMIKYSTFFNYNKLNIINYLKEYDDAKTCSNNE